MKRTFYQSLELPESETYDEQPVHNYVESTVGT